MPRFAVQTGVRCSNCHVNPTGSGKRNDTLGHVFLNDLMLDVSKKLTPKNITGRVTDFLAGGTDVRIQNATTWSDPVTNSFTVPQGSLYLEVNAGKHITGYVDYDLANTVNREAFGMVHNLPYDLYLKVGRIKLPYGLRIDDDSSPIRTNLNMTFANPDIGGEVGIAPGPFEFAVALSNGVPGGVGDENLAKAYTTSVQWIHERGRVGSSFQWNKRSANRLLQAAIFGGFKVGRFLWLGEADWQQRKSYTGLGSTTLFAAYSELNYWIMNGLYAKAIYDFVDPDYRFPNNLQHRMGIGFDVYPLPFSKFSLLYRLNVAAGAPGDDQFLARFHFFF